MRVMARHAASGPGPNPKGYVSVRVLFDDEDERAYQEYAKAHPMATEYRGDLTREEYVEIRLREPKQAQGLTTAEVSALSYCVARAQLDTETLRYDVVKAAEKALERFK